MKNKNKKNLKPDPTKPTDEDIHIKQQVVEDICQTLKNGVQLNHVPLLDSGSDNEDNNKENYEHTENIQRCYDLHESQSSDDELFDAPIFPSTNKVKKQQKSNNKTPLSVFSLIWRFSGIIQIVPLILRCVFNTSLLFLISKTLNFYGYIFSLLHWFTTKIEVFLPLLLVTGLHFFTNLITNLNGHVTEYMDSKKQENEDKIQKVYDIIMSYTKNLVKNFQKIEDSIQDYSPTLRVRENMNLFFVLGIRSFVWLTLPFVEYFKMRSSERKKSSLV